MIRSLALRVKSTKELVVDLNRCLAEDLDRDMFMSLLILRFDTRTGRITYTGAGHEHLIIYRAKSDECEARKAGGMVLGLTEDISTFVTEEVLDLASGDALILYTDGVTEAFDSQREMYQLERLLTATKRYASRAPGPCVEAILADVMGFAGKTPQSDDITLVTIRKE